MNARKIQQYKLDVKKTLPYFLDHIRCGKTLSVRVCEKIDFSRGFFFTILPSNVVLTKLFAFDEGGIISPEFCADVSCDVKKRATQMYPKKIITMDQECSEFIAKFLGNSNANLAVVENYMLDPQSPYVEVLNVQVAVFGAEVYYVLNKNNSVSEIYKTIRKSSQVWHFLAVLSRLQGGISANLTDFAMDQICQNVQFVIAGAYDGEGYIFWEAPNKS